MGTEWDREVVLLNAGLLWKSLLRKVESVASSRKEAVSAGAFGMADPAQGKSREAILCEKAWGVIRWEIL